jgi:transpeptidase family protein
VVPHPRAAARSAGARTLLVRALLWSLPLALAALGLVLLRRARAEADLAEAAELLARARPGEARPLLERHRDSGRHGAKARAGLAAVAGLDGSPAPGAFEPADLALFRPRLLVDSALRGGDFAAALRMARLARAAGDPIAPAYEAAALVERGEDEAAAAILPPALASTPGLGQRVARVLEARAAGAAVTVTDRRGVLAGFLDGEGAFHPEPGGAAEWVPAAAIHAVRAGDRRGVRLSADFDRSAAALAALGPYRGSVVLIDLATGEVLAAVTDARTRDAEGGTPAFEQRREPASIAKIMTTAAAWRAGHDADAEVSRMVCNGSHRYRGGVLWCSYPAGPLTGGLKQAFALSCNIAFANLAIEVGWRGMVDELHLWGFDRPSTEVPGAGRVLETEGTERDLASLGIGLDAAEITPLHAALLGSVLATGHMPEPALLSAGDGTLGLSPRPIARRAPRRILEPAWVPRMQQALAGVVEEGGTAQGVAPESFPVVMKTGTASAPGLGYHVNYIGAGPLPHPTIGFAVRVTHQRTSQRVRDAAQEVLARLLEALGRAGR